MATMRLPLINPSPVFGLALLLVVMLLGVTKLFSVDWMPAVGLACVSALEWVWHFSHFDPANPNQPLGLVLAWYLIFFAVFALFPFLFLETIFRQSCSVGDGGDGRTAAIFSHPPVRIRRLSEPNDGTVARGICDSRIVEPRQPF